MDLEQKVRGISHQHQVHTTESGKISANPETKPNLTRAVRTLHSTSSSSKKGTYFTYYQIIAFLELYFLIRKQCVSGVL